MKYERRLLILTGTQETRHIPFEKDFESVNEDE